MADLATWPIGRFKDLPEVFKAAFEKMPGAVPCVAYQNGQFFKIINIRMKDGWPEQVKIALDSDDCLVIDEGFGVTARILSALQVRP